MRSKINASVDISPEAELSVKIFSSAADAFQSRVNTLFTYISGATPSKVICPKTTAGIPPLSWDLKTVASRIHDLLVGEPVVVFVTEVVPPKSSFIVFDALLLPTLPVAYILNP